MEFDVTDKVVKDKESFKKMMNLFFIIMISIWTVVAFALTIVSIVFMNWITLAIAFVILIIDLVFFVCWRWAKAKDFKSTRTSFRLEGKEATYFLFGRKVSPCCNTKMNRITEKIHQGEGLFQSGSDEEKIMAHGDTYKMIFKYQCPCCNKVYNISELVNK